MATGTAEVIRVEDLEELLGSRPLCEVRGLEGEKCRRLSDFLIRYRCECFTEFGQVREAWICQPHYTFLRWSKPGLVYFKCSYCGTSIRDWKEL